MHPLIFGHSFAGFVLLILLPGVAFYFLNKKKADSWRSAKVADTDASASMIVPTEANTDGCSSSPAETNNGTENNYEVFLSFRGEDTRNNFADHLYSGLLSAGIRVFRDNEELHQGKEIGPDLFAAIQSSMILIPILSVNYGWSKWCLDELVQIMECKNNNKGHLVLPIFYKVEPADVRYQKGSFGVAFHKREKRERERGVDQLIFQKWKQALQEVSNLKGHEVNGNGSEAELIKSIVRPVLFQLKEWFELVVPENLIGIDTHVENITKFVDNNSLATLFLGIHGMGGIGKTTLAKAIYNKLFNQFEHHSFIADVRESCKGKGLPYLQNQLIFDILKQKDEVSNKDEGIKYISSMFKCKKVLILLDDIGHDNQLEALAGNHNWFSLGSIIIITTRNKSILDNVRVDYPYEHEKMGQQNSLILFSRHAFRRDSPPSEFKDLTHAVVSTTGGLPLSLKVLGSFLSRKETRVWRGTIEKLKEVPNEEVQQSLKISYDELTYEGKQFFLDVACFFIGTDWRIASYMWEACKFFPKVEIEELRLLSLIKVGDDHKLIMHDQLRDLGRAIVREEDKMKPRNRSRLWDSNHVLEVLKENEGTEKIEAICFKVGYYLNYGFHDILTGKQFEKLRNLRFLQADEAHLRGDFWNSFKKLKWLQWRCCSSNFEANNFHVEELVILNLSHSKISDKWQGWNSIVMASKLKYLNLSRCMFLQKTDFLSAFRNLEVLILTHCGRIEQIDSSIGNMKSLLRLDLTDCIRLKELPAEVSKLEALEQLLLQGCGIEQLPDSIWNLHNLEILNIRFTRIKAIPNGIGRLRKLRDLDASCSHELERGMPESIRHCSSLQRLDLQYSQKVQLPPVLPSSLTFLGISCQSRKLPSLSNLTHLKELRLQDCRFLECLWEKPSALSETSPNTPFELEILEISSCNLMQTLDISQFKHLKTLSARFCNNLREIRGLDRLKYLESLQLIKCGSIERLNLPKSEGLKMSSARDCKNFAEVQAHNGLESLEEIDISGISIQRLDISNCNGLKRLSIGYFKNFLEVQGLDRLESLEILDKSRRTSFKSLPDMCCFDTLQKLVINWCDNLLDIQSLETSLRIGGSKSLTKFPNLSNSVIYIPCSYQVVMNFKRSRA